MLNFSRKTLILIGALATLVVLLLILALNINGTKKPYSSQVTITPPPTPVVEKTATVSFAPASLDLSTTTAGSVDIVADSGGKPITGVQVEVQFDPKVVTNVKIAPPVGAAATLLGPSALMLFNTTNPTRGNATYAIAINPSARPVTGAGTVGKLTFTVVKNGATPTTQLTFGTHTIVTVPNSQNSALKQSTPLTVKLQ